MPCHACRSWLSPYRSRRQRLMDLAKLAVFLLTGHCLPCTLPFCSRSALNSSLLVVITASPLLDISFDPFELLFTDLAFRVTFFENLQRILSVAHRERHL